MPGFRSFDATTALIIASTAMMRKAKRQRDSQPAQTTNTISEEEKAERERMAAEIAAERDRAPRAFERREKKMMKKLLSKKPSS